MDPTSPRPDGGSGPGEIRPPEPVIIQRSGEARYVLGLLTILCMAALFLGSAWVLGHTIAALIVGAVIVPVAAFSYWASITNKVVVDDIGVHVHDLPRSRRYKWEEIAGFRSKLKPHPKGDELGIEMLLRTGDSLWLWSESEELNTYEQRVHQWVAGLREWLAYSRRAEKNTSQET